MRKAFALTVTLALQFPGLAAADAQQPPIVMPFFSSTVAGPAFFVECRNDSKEAVSSGATRWLSALRLDGNGLADDGRIGPGVTSMVPAGEVWRGIVVLRQDGTGHFPAVKFGALVRMSRVTPLAEGRHTFAVRCGDIWSDESTFFWENARQ